MKSPLILIVEDDLASLILETAALEKEGLGVDGADSAEAARDIIAKRRPDLILVDIQLPGIDGLEFTRELKASPDTSSIPVVAVTAHNMPLYERAAKAAGCEGFIAKPVSPAALIAQVRTFLDALGTRTG